MATSGSYNFTQTRNEIIKDAFLLLKVLDIDDTVSSNDQLLAERCLNRLIKEWQAEDIYMWNMKEGTLFLAEDDAEYSIGPSGDHCTGSYVRTQTSAAASAGASSVSVDSVTGMTAGDYIGIKLDDGSRQWTTISSIASLTITLGAVLTGASAVDSYVFTYTNKIQRPIHITTVRRMDTSDYESSLDLVSRDKYFSISNKTTAGLPNLIHYSPTLTNGTLWVYPRPSASEINHVINFSYYEAFEDFDSSTDNADIPGEYLDALVLSLAENLAIYYAVTPEDVMQISQRIQMKKMMLRSQNANNESVFLRIDHGN